MSIDLDQLIRGAIESTTDRRAKGRAKEHGAKQAPRALPQVSLLPVEVRGQGKARRVRGLLVAGVLMGAVVATGGAVLAGAASSDADARVAASSARLSAVTTQLRQFADVQALQQRVALGTAAVRVGSSTEVDWQRWSGLILQDIPGAFTVTEVKADGATPYLDYPQGSTPIDGGQRVATFTVTATTSSIAELPVWLRKLKSLPAYLDLSPTVSGGAGAYTVQVVVHLSPDAYVRPLKETK